MFSRWDFARSAEAVFSRWAIKRVCKFLLKKRLGDLILGDIDLDQLDVQLGRGTIQLADLALNVDFLNQKLSGAAVMVKEGSIGSLSIKIPWKLKNCQIEVEELELVLSPYVGSSVPMATNCGVPSDDGIQHMDIDSSRPEVERVQGNLESVSLDVHEGVKTIAKIVKWFLTSFHVRLKNLIVAFDPGSDVHAKRSLVLRIAETEYGTCVSEDAPMPPDLRPGSLLGAKLTNFIKFKGAEIEFLSLEDVDNRPQLHSDLGTSFSEWYAGSLPSGCTTTIMTGSSGGFSGTLNLSIPWKNGSLDIRRVDADAIIDPVELRIEPSIIQWIIVAWESLRCITPTESHAHNKTADSAYLSSRLHNHSMKVVGMQMPSMEHTSENFYFTGNQETLPDALLPQTHLIHNWVPLSINQEEEIKLEPDYGASIDQFFSCFDGMRSSQASSGSSGIWNWTCSVFNAITVASNLASGSGQIPIEQQHTETNVQATFAGISVVILFHSEEQRNMNSPLRPMPSNDSYMSCLSSVNLDRSTLKEVTSTNLDVNHLEVRCKTVVFNFQVCRQKTRFEALVMHVKVDEYYESGKVAGSSNFDDYNKVSYTQVSLSQHLQRQVQDPLPPFPFAADHDSEETNVKANAQRVINSTSSQIELVKVTVFESFGLCSCHYAASSADSDDRPIASTSFSFNLPPFVFWVHFQLVNILLDLFKEVEKSFQRSSTARDSTSDASNGRNDSFLNDVKCGAPSYITTVTPRASIQGNIVIPCARVILCFPSEDHGDSRYSTTCDKFIVLEFSPHGGVGKVSDIFPATKASFPKGNCCTPSTSIHLNTGNLESYLVTSTRRDDDDKLCTMDGLSFSAVKLLSVSNRADDCHSGITLLWQKGPVTGPWIASRAWSLATPHDQRRNKVTGKGCEFSSVTTAENLGEKGSHVRQELILSSAFFLHVHFSHVSIILGNCDYRLLNHLVNYVMDGLSICTHDTETATSKSLGNKHSSFSDSSRSQASVLLECDVLEFCITLDEFVQTSCSIQKELQGSWKSLRLRVEKFELLSVSNIGGINNSNYLWLNHGEGELWGSIIDSIETVAAQDFLLITCRNSAVKRGDGDGVNALSFGIAGAGITYLSNPQTFERFTSIIVRCATIVAPGGRFDWVNAMCFFFSLPSSENEQSGNNITQNKFSEDHAVYKASFFLELMDVGLSYEPYTKDKLVSSEFPDLACSSAVESTEQSGEQSVACFLAASSLYLCNHNVTNSESTDYKFQLQDVGLLICECTGSRDDKGGYPVDYLRKTGYVKVAKEALVETVLRIKDDFWEVECLESHINLHSCHDTTFGLVRLISQLQQLYAPDMEDALVHLQSRWNRVQKKQIDDNSANVVEASSSSSEKLISSNEDGRSVGLLDEILEDAFHTIGEHEYQFGSSGLQSNVSLDKIMHGGVSELNVSSPAATEFFDLNIPPEKSIGGSAMGTQIIESYYLSDLVPSSRQTAGNHSLTQDHKGKCDVTACNDTVFGKGGWYKDGSLMIVENHISKVSSGDGEQPPHQEHSSSSGSLDPSLPCRASGIVLLKNIDLTWRMYAGYDWSKPRKNSHCHSNSNGRDGSVCLELTLSGMNLQYDIYPDGEVYVTKLHVSVKDLHLSDISKDAPWKMVLGYYHSKDHLRESFSNAFKLDLEVVRPDPLTPLEEYRLQLEFLPMRLHLDQSQLNFLVSFFGKNSSAEESQKLPDNLDGKEVTWRKSTSFGCQTIVEEALLPFFQKCIVRPVVLRVDYIPRHIDLAALRGGNYAELLNLVPWKGIDLHLKHVCALGVYGWSSICETVVAEWLEDISHNQVHKLLKGLPPIKSLFAVSSGASKLVSLPVKSYKKDHKLLKGMQRGAIAFVKSISLEAVGLGVHLAAGAHEILLQTEYILTSIPPSVPVSEKGKSKASVRVNQPKDAQQGIQQAYESLSDGLSRTASALVGTPFKTYQRGAGAGSALATAVRSAPVAAMAPVSASARAVHYALLGVRNSLDPEHKKESMEKYLGHSQS